MVNERRVIEDDMSFVSSPIATKMPVNARITIYTGARLLRHRLVYYILYYGMHGQKPSTTELLH